MAAQNPSNFVFVLAPTLVNQGAINYAIADRIKLWKVGIEPLAKEPFTLEAHKFKVFLTIDNARLQCSKSDLTNLWL